MNLPWIERMDDRLEALAESLRTALPARIVKRSLMHFDQHTDLELEAGVVMTVSDGEGDYLEFPGRTCIEGKHNMLLICHLQVEDTGRQEAIEAAELDLIEDLKAWIRSGVPGMDFQDVAFKHSRQLEYPFGWVVAQLRLVPPKMNTY